MLWAQNDRESAQSVAVARAFLEGLTGREPDTELVGAAQGLANIEPAMQPSLCAAGDLNRVCHSQVKAEPEDFSCLLPCVDLCLLVPHIAVHFLK